jgi:signal transduction histidine kinase
MPPPPLRNVLALRATGLLDTPPEADFDRLTELVRRVLRVPVALVSLVDADRQFFKSQQGLAEPWASLRETPLSHSFCCHVVDRDAALAVEDARQDALVRDNMAIQDLGVVAYLGVPLRTPDGVAVGSLCAIDAAPRTWTPADGSALEALAASAMTAIAARHHARERDAAVEALQEANAALEARVEDRTREVRRLAEALILAEQGERQRVAHVLHEDLQQVLFGARMAAAVGDPEHLERTLDEATRLARTLSHDLAPPILRGDGLGDLLRWVADRERTLHGAEVEVEVRGEIPPLGEPVRVLLYGLVREFLFNVAKHAGTAQARVTAERLGPLVRVTVEDEGVGFDVADDRGGLGLAAAGERAALVGGLVRVDSAPGEGTRVAVEVPHGGPAGG